MLRSRQLHQLLVLLELISVALGKCLSADMKPNAFVVRKLELFAKLRGNFSPNVRT